MPLPSPPDIATNDLYRMNSAVISRGVNPVDADNVVELWKDKCSGVSGRRGVVDGSRGDG